MIQKILIPALCNASPHQETELEIIEQHLSQHDEIYYISCNGEITNCFLWQYPTKDACSICKKKFSTGVSLLSKKISILGWESSAEMYLQKKFFFKNTAELKKFSIDGKNIGLCVASTLISELNNEDFNTVAYAKLIQDNLSTAYFIYNSFKKIVERIQPNLVYLFNGRHTTEAPIIMVCKEKNIPFYTHEIGNIFFRYRITYNSLPHATAPIEQECNKLYPCYGHKQALEIANKFYSARREGEPLGGISYTQQQKHSALPDGFDPKKKNIVFFNSSIFEFAALPGFSSLSKYYNSEDEALLNVARDCADDPDIHIYCRMHPNLSQKDNKQVRILRSLIGTNKNLTVIPPESDIDSYALMEQSKIIVTFHSTMGAEASFWGKPVIIIGFAAYRHLEGFYRPESHTELIKLLHSDLKKLPNIGAIKYGLWMQEGGVPFKYYIPKTRFSGEFKGVDIDLLARKKLLMQKLKEMLIDLSGAHGYTAAKNSFIKLKKNFSIKKVFFLLKKISDK